MSAKKPNYKNIWLYVVITLTMLLIGDRLEGLLVYGIYVGGIYTGNLWVVSLLYIGNSVIYGVESIIQCGVRVAVMVVALLLHKRLHKQIGKVLLVLYIGIANVFYLAYQYSDVGVLLDRSMYVVLSGVMAFVAIYTLRAIFVRGLRYQPQLDEIICISLYGVLCVYCLDGISLGMYTLAMFVIPLAIIMARLMVGDITSLIVSFLCGMAVVLSQGIYLYMVVYVSMAVAVVMCYRLNRYVSSLSVIVVDVVLAYFMDTYTQLDIYVLLPTVIASAITMLVPTRVLTITHDMLGNNNSQSGIGIVNKLRTSLSARLYQLSVVFMSMKNVFMSMASGNVDKGQAKVTLVKNISDNVCVGCQQRQDCWRTNIAKTEQSMLSLCDCAIERGKVTILDLSPNITTGCKRLSSVLSYINSQSQAYNNYATIKSTVNDSRMLVGEQLGGVSQLMNKLSMELKGRLVFDTGKEQEIKNQLTFHGIMVSEVVFVDTGNDIEVILTVASSDIEHTTICSIVGGIVKKSLYIDKVEPTTSQAWSSVFLAVAPQYSLCYGIRTVAKHNSEVSGDTHSFVKIAGNKCMLSVCDGMGSGKDAELVSSTAITLVENFYRAGFDNDIILSCVNRLMAGYNSETFTAVDICVVDLQCGLADFIKLGGSAGLVKNRGEVSVIVGNSLPLGAVGDNTAPSITKKALQSGDIIVIASDGLWDTVKDSDVVGDIVNNTIVTNPQIIADSIMDKALMMCNNKPIDDITVIVARIV